MHSFKKIIINSVIFVLLFTVICAAISASCFVDGTEYNDSGKRNELAGTIDTFFVGASMSVSGFVPQIFDSKLGCNSYNLSGDGASLIGRYELLKYELPRNPVKTVFLEISYSLMTEYIKTTNATGEPRIITKLDNVGQQFSYFFNNVNLLNNDYENFFSVLLRYGIKAWGDLFSGKINTIQENKGFRGDPSVDVTLSDAEIIYDRKVYEHGFDFKDESIEILEKTISMCHDYGVKVYIITTPNSNGEMWRYKDLDLFNEKMSTLAEKNDCSFIDSNLFSNRFDLFSDKNSFSNKIHLSEKGAYAFSNELADLLASGDECNPDCYYQSYYDLDPDSPYMEFYLAHKDD